CCCQLHRIVAVFQQAKRMPEEYPWVRIASSVQRFADDYFHRSGSLSYSCTLEAMRTQVFLRSPLIPTSESHDGASAFSNPVPFPAPPLPISCIAPWQPCISRPGNTDPRGEIVQVAMLTDRFQKFFPDR